MSDAELLSVKKVESNGSTTVTLSEITMSSKNSHVAINSNGPVLHTGENGINGTTQKSSDRNSYGVQNGASNVVIANSNPLPETFPPSYDDAVHGEYWTTKADSSIRLRIGDTEATNKAPLTVNQLFERTVGLVPNRIALAVKREGRWRHWTYSEYYEEVRAAAKSFIKLGLEPYHGVGIVGFNSPEWLISDFGAIYAGGLATGIYTTNSPEACYYVASDSSCNVIVVENKMQLDKILKVWDRLPKLKAIVQYIGQVEEKRENVYDWNEFLEAGKDVSDDKLESRISQLQPNRCCTLIYTSGTTGNPKGVMLSHDNKVSTYRRCPLTGSVHLWEVSTYGRCPLMGGVYLWEVSAYGRCPLMGGVHLWEVSTYGRCPLMGVVPYERCPLWEVSTMGGVHLREVSTYGRCPLMGVVPYGRCPLWEVSTMGGVHYGRCLLMGGVYLWEVSTYGRCPLVGGVHLWEVSTCGRCPLVGGVHLWEVSTCGRCPLVGGVHLWEVSTYGKCPLMGSVHLCEVYTYVRCPLWEVSTYGRCLLMGGSSYGRCPLMGGVYLWEGLLMGGVHLWEVSTCGRCPLVGGVHLWEVSTCGRCPLTGGVYLQEMTWIAQTSCIHVDAGLHGEEHVVSYLPLSHIAAQQTDIFMPLVCCASTWFAQPDALKGSLVHTLKEARPTMILGVPRVWEKIMEKMLQLGAGVTGMKRKIANWAKSVALQGNQNIEQGKPVPFGWTVANAVVLKKVKVALGLDRCRLTFVGAAPVTLETLQYFQSINIPLYELYGMSECSGPHTVSIPGHIISGSCGVPMPGCESKIINPDEDGCGELCIRGRHVFMGYLNNLEKTEESLDDEGWLHSGDVAKIDKVHDGYCFLVVLRDQLYITGRIKELIITAGGENVAPVPIEESILKELPVISNIMVIGDKKKFLSCLVTLKVVVEEESGEPTDNLNSIALDFCNSIGCEAKKVSEILSTKDEKLFKAIQDGINRANDYAPSRAQKVFG
ncbi:hypothetical protein QZH41_018138 [Actinostola sp. cb2023]|nr:hypothetical protein QZH41_018138 [Actinostola sp. cb2023]